MKYFDLPDDLVLPTIEEIVEIHDEQLSLYGGMRGQNAEKFTGVDATLGRVWAHVNYSDNPDLLSAVAILWHGLNEAHAFLDANKRTALMAMATTLEMNGVTYARGDEYAALFIENLFAQKAEDEHVRVEDFEIYLRQNTRVLYVPAEPDL